MEVTEHLAELRLQGALLATAASATDLDTPIPTCPEWTMRDLLRHMGDVHRWAAAHVRERRALGIRDVASVAGALPGDSGLLEWYREGHAALLATLQTADPDVECWTFLPAPSPLAFWARRQAHETAIHRADAESPSGRFTPFDPGFAVDGIRELLEGFLARRSADGPIGEPVWTLRVRATDTGDEWTARVGEQAIELVQSDGPAGCTVRTIASDLQLFLWNRQEPDPANVHGDASLLERWREVSRITWGRPRAPA